MRHDLLICIPTYNERENVEDLLRQVLALRLPADVLFVDDNSPDGTGALLDALAARHPEVAVLHRAGKLGVGSAHAAGIRHACVSGYRLLLTMDCDFTHSPDYIRDSLAKSESADVVVGSRYMQADSLADWNIFRRILTRCGHAATRILLDLPQDATGAFRLYRLDRISRHFIDTVHSPGYSFFFESLYVLKVNGYRIVEVPTRLPARTYGHSKMRWRDATHSLIRILHTRLTAMINPRRFVIAEPFRPPNPSPALVDPQNWDAYWAGKGDKTTLLIYDLIAAFYRKAIIRPSLNHFAGKYFRAGSRLLHAGCGSGEVDRDIATKFSIAALDISPGALSLYRKTNPHSGELIHGSIFALPLPDGGFDGVYNLGVMEHFTEDEIRRILLEFKRVLKPGGRLLLFWPPEYGLSVIVLKAVHAISRHLVRSDLSLHPPEITRVRSRRQISGYLAAAGFELEEFAFGFRDLLTFAVIVARKP